MMAQKKRFVTGEVNAWMDCGNKEITVATNTTMLHFLAEEGERLIDSSAQLENSTIIPPCYIGKNVVLTNATIGPGVSIGQGTQINNATIKDSIIQQYSVVENVTLEKAMIGNHVRYNGTHKRVSLGDYTELI